MRNISGRPLGFIIGKKRSKAKVLTWHSVEDDGPCWDLACLVRESLNK